MKRSPMPRRKTELARRGLERRKSDAPLLRRRRAMVTAAPREGTRRAQERELDKLTSELTRDRESLCVLCGEYDPQKLTCGHLFKRGHRLTRWDIHPSGNCHTLCKICNGRDNEDHSVYVDWYKGRYGRAAYAALERRARTRRKVSEVEMGELLCERRLQYAKLRRAA